VLDRNYQLTDVHCTLSLLTCHWGYICIFPFKFLSILSILFHGWRMWSRKY